MRTKLLSSLIKVFPVGEPEGKDYSSASCLKGELFHLQAAFYMEEGEGQNLPLIIDSPLKDYISLYAVQAVPSMFPAYNERHDVDYISLEPGLFPDLLVPVKDNLRLVGRQWRSLFIEVDTGNAPAGEHKLCIKLGDEELCFTLTVLPVCLPEQKLIYTQWFHCDCIASHYNVPVFSKEHWELMVNYMENAAKYGMNLLLTPVLTPPLDTEVGGERPTVQLVDIELVGEGYSYSYEKLDKYIALAKEKGIKYFEISHPFSQWGAAFAPKVVAKKNGKLTKIFGWETSATSKEYSSFIRSFLISLKAHLKELGVLDSCYFHVSDEPGREQLESYAAALEIVKDIYADLNVIDALSDYDFYKEGLVRKPIPANNHIEPFLANNVPGLWTYYCCAQCVDVSNRFFAMPSRRNRIIGHQLYKFGIEGFLHWGYNFWYKQFSKGKIDPFFVTDSGEGFPSGDPFSVYPGEDGKPLPSIRQLVFSDALQDLRAMELLESLSSKEEVLKLIAGVDPCDISFSHYPRYDSFLLESREKINMRCKELADSN